MSASASNSLSAERDRITLEYERRARELNEQLYAPWNPAELFLRSERKRHAATMLQAAGCFPLPGNPCLEIGYGRIGWLGELISWSVRVDDLHGIELDANRAAVAQRALPGADLRVGDATELPWADGSFPLVVISTVFTSILDDTMRIRIAREIERVLSPGGALLWYDFAVNNPRNSQVRRVTRTDLQRYFPNLRGSLRSVTLAPPLARRIVPWSWLAAQCLEALPFLRTHLLGVLKKPGGISA